ncbi:Histidinol-phosphate aminotransferase [hydrothermal vent metagenome]|uniref:Histidinol-phosphate aminotransferase n=1 Tax=hydrothermal vent metagenome TaxID=652676 RepID=A0A3B0XE17_9ZZZZ
MSENTISNSSALEKACRWIRPLIKKIDAYHVADASGLIKLDAMENPYRLSDDLLETLQEKLADADLNRYPDPSAKRLRDKLREVMQVPENKSIVLGNGSDELIQMLAMAVVGVNNDVDKGGKDVCLMSFDPGFVMYKMISDFVGIKYVGVTLREDFSLDMQSTRKAIKENQPAIIFIAYPNNPSANCYSEKDIEEIISIAPGIVVLDEAYHPFAQTSFMPRLTQCDNLLVMRTVSKMGLAGLRLGLLCGHSDIINEIDKIRLPYNINVLTQITAEFVLDNIDELNQQAKMIREEREILLGKMNAMLALRVFPSQANFILFRVLEKSANDVFESIKKSGVLIKNMKADSGLLKNCLRVTVGTPNENLAFLAALALAIKSEQ